MINEQIAEREATKRSIGEQGQQNNSECQTKGKRLAFFDTLLEAYEDGEISREGVREEVDQSCLRSAKKIMNDLRQERMGQKRNPRLMAEICESQ